MHYETFTDTLAKHQLDLKPISLDTLQVNITKLCNQTCVHCHVDASPRRKEMMSDEVLDACLTVLRAHESLRTLDITGGAPELHPRFKGLVVRARALGKRVIVRHNLTVTLDPHPTTKQSMEYLPDFFREQGVEVVSSLPCYAAANTDKQRGDGVYDKSIESLKRLNAVGFGTNPDLVLNLVYNPVGTALPGSQADLEAAYKCELQERHGISFNHLFALTNMPIHRFKAHLVVNKIYDDYMHKLAAHFNPDAARGVMCRTMLSVSHDGKLYDCDFNQMLNMQVSCNSTSKTIFDLSDEAMLSRKISFGDHCYGCTAGTGSSCGGSTLN